VTAAQRKGNRVEKERRKELGRRGKGTRKEKTEPSLLYAKKKRVFPRALGNLQEPTEKKIRRKAGTKKRRKKPRDRDRKKSSPAYERRRERDLDGSESGKEVTCPPPRTKEKDARLVRRCEGDIEGKQRDVPKGQREVEATPPLRRVGPFLLGRANKSRKKEGEKKRH